MFYCYMGSADENRTGATCCEKKTSHICITTPFGQFVYIFGSYFSKVLLNNQ